jgi:hypothetical protein
LVSSDFDKNSYMYLYASCRFPNQFDEFACDIVAAGSKEKLNWTLFSSRASCVCGGVSARRSERQRTVQHLNVANGSKLQLRLVRSEKAGGVQVGKVNNRQKSKHGVAL